MTAARPETGATDKAERLAILRRRYDSLNRDLTAAHQRVRSAQTAEDDVVDQLNRCKRQIEWIESDKVLVPRAYLDALTALLDAGSCIGVADGRWAAEKFWQNAEDEKDAAREEMGE